MSHAVVVVARSAQLRLRIWIWICQMIDRKKKRSKKFLQCLGPPFIYTCSNSCNVSSELMYYFQTSASEMIHCSELRLRKIAMVRNDASEGCNPSMKWHTDSWNEMTVQEKMQSLMNRHELTAKVQLLEWTLPLFRRGMLWLYKLGFFHRFSTKFLD